MEQEELGFNDSELNDIMNEIEDLEQEISQKTPVNSPEAINTEEELQEEVQEKVEEEIEIQEKAIENNNITPLPISSAISSAPVSSKITASNGPQRSSLVVLDNQQGNPLCIKMKGQNILITLNDFSQLCLELESGLKLILPE